MVQVPGMGVIVRGVSSLGATLFQSNLKADRPGATDEEMVRAARQAQAHDFILQQPQGYQTLVGERGSKLNGGERQGWRLAASF